MTTGSVRASEHERRYLAARTRWWNSTGGGSRKEQFSKGGGNNKGVVASAKGIGAVKAGDGGVKFRAEWGELDEENWKWMEEHRVDPATGNLIPSEGEGGQGMACSKEVAALARGPNGSGFGSVVGGGQALQDAGNGWVRRHKVLVFGMVVVGIVLLNRIFGEGGQ